MSSSSSGWLTNSRKSSPGRSDSSLLDSLLRGLNELVDWEVLTSLGTEVRDVFIQGLSPMLLRRNEWGLEEGARGLLLLCDGMILTKSNFQRQIGNTSVKCEANLPWKRRHSNAKLRKVITQADRNVRQERDPSDKYLLVAGCSSDSVTLIINSKTAAKDDDSRSLQTKRL